MCDRNNHTVAVDGSVFEHYPGFKKTMENALIELNCPVLLELCKDGSGKGAAIVAVATQKA